MFEDRRCRLVDVDVDIDQAEAGFGILSSQSGSVSVILPTMMLPRLEGISRSLLWISSSSLNSSKKFSSSTAVSFWIVASEPSSGVKPGKPEKCVEAEDLLMGRSWREDFEELVPAEKGFAVIDAEIEIMFRQVHGQLEKLVMGELADEAAAARIDREQIEIVPHVVGYLLVSA